MNSVKSIQEKDIQEKDIQEKDIQEKDIQEKYNMSNISESDREILTEYITSNGLNSNLDHVSMQKMLFIYNAVIDGWTVKILSKDKYEFKKSKSSISKNIDINDYLKDFVKNNLSINNIINNNKANSMTD